MIQPLMSNPVVSFQKGNKTSSNQQTSQQATENVETNEVAKEPKVGFFKKVKNGFLTVVKSFNNVSNVGTGFARGAVEGAVVASAVALVGKNCSKTKGLTFKSLGGIIKDLWKAGKTVITKGIPRIITESPLDNVKTLFGSTGNAIKKLASGARSHKLTAAIATGLGATVVIARTIQGKARANKTNAELDHITNHGHQK